MLDYRTNYDEIESELIISDLFMGGGKGYFGKGVISGAKGRYILG